ncbi:Lrp/AsnC family transcriptional regulator [Paracoccus sp. 1_MG-2023]|uniref:Lrp/AsnC family transcriptional regulator n=1 Tax=unclassified Paracoccus (in: a-proteobacteria) TaxID=2688777 RepID=UPI001C089F31|nr:MULTISPECIES: Lrp/AsnC family transcriptional regulator [unclassified Paracoccus (in: a-proteobacteria)]MBU2957739.1 Lrp/AsnC family transcriptional regulator [Paracoccus sp. C2R09]MDO6667413.1 Lrp/AsnC family transcriptional regulator [Paracoccus sp. 1_MG-2023]
MLDLIDRKIAAELMMDATQPIARIADKVGLSQTPCWKRVQRLEASGVLTRRVSLGDPQKLGLGLSVFVGIKAADHGPEWKARFLAHLNAQPWVMEIWRVAGDQDWMLRLALPDMAAYDAFYVALTDAVPVAGFSSTFGLERVHHTTALPVDVTTR